MGYWAGLTEVFSTYPQIKSLRIASWKGLIAVFDINGEVLGKTDREEDKSRLIDLEMTEAQVNEMETRLQFLLNHCPDSGGRTPIQYRIYPRSTPLRLN